MLGASSDKSIENVTLEEVTKKYFPLSKALVLQMDIEGSEYEVLNSLGPDALKEFALVLVEFHHFHRLNENQQWNSSIKNAVHHLMNDFLLIHSHPNTAGGFFLWRFKKIPKVVETTWVRKSLINSVHGKAKLPHPLDRRNDLLMEDLQFPKLKQA